MCQVVTYLKMLPTVFFYVISLTFHIACLNRLSNFTCYSKVKDNSSRYFGTRKLLLLPRLPLLNLAIYTRR